MTSREPRSPIVAAALSLLFPGLGQYAAGARRRGVLIAIPALVVLTAIVGFGIGTVLGGGPQAVLGILLSPQVLVAVVAADLVWLAYHAFAILDAWLIARRARLDVGHQTGLIAIVGLLAVLLVATLGHGSVAALGMETEDTLAAVFRGDDSAADPNGDWAIPEASFGPDEEDSPTPPPTATPAPAIAGVPPSLIPTLPPTPSPAPVPDWARDGRLNILLVGSDAGTGRWLLRTDTMVLLSVDIESGQAAMFGIPRNLINVPLAGEDAEGVPRRAVPGAPERPLRLRVGPPVAVPGRRRPRVPGGHRRDPGAGRRAARRVRRRRPPGLRAARQLGERAVDPAPRGALRQPLPQGRRVGLHHDLVQGGLPEARPGRRRSNTPARGTRTRTTAGCAVSS